MKNYPAIPAFLACLIFLSCGDLHNPGEGKLSPEAKFDFSQSAQTSVNTKIVKKPANPSNSTTAKFSFKCTAAPCTFKCQLDGSAWKKCSSPKSYQSLSSGAHTFKVKGISNGKSDPSPAKYSWIIEYWEAASASGLSARSELRAVWTGTEMIVWGGFSGSYHNDGARYNPATDSWTSTSTANAPSARMRYSLVRTNDGDIIIWGGDNGSQLNTGGIYDPSTNSWIVTSTDNAPTGRSLHTAIYTGTEMIVWGGNDGLNNGYNTGGRYNPANNTWTAATSTDNAPVGRFFHTVVYTGTQMIIWGGYGGGALDSGGIYNVSGNSWTPTASIGAPSGRHRHSAVWTDTEMIIWGGEGGPTTNTGARYNPTSNSWTATSMTNAPEQRTEHSAVWDWNEMIVWGGFGTGDYVFSGGRYNPTLDSWTATTTVGAPTPRGNHIAVWTGTQMIIWGGEYNGGKLNTGARYFH